jgi:hypothetical protein
MHQHSLLEPLSTGATVPVEGRQERSPVPVAITQNRECTTTTADIGRMADVSQAPAGQDQSRSGCSGDEEDVGISARARKRCRAAQYQHWEPM